MDAIDSLSGYEQIFEDIHVGRREQQYEYDANKIKMLMYVCAPYPRTKGNQTILSMSLKKQKQCQKASHPSNHIKLSKKVSLSYIIYHIVVEVRNSRSLSQNRYCPTTIPQDIVADSHPIESFRNFDSPWPL